MRPFQLGLRGGGQGGEGGGREAERQAAGE